jgi:hypothetical protein
MGAMHNDINRCSFMFTDDRRCRNLIHTPGAPFCTFHVNSQRKKTKPAPADEAANREFFQWLAAHPLDNVTNVNHATNLITLLLAGKRISVRRADALLRLLRVAMKSVYEVQREFDIHLIRKHWPQGTRFLNEIQPLLAAAVPAAPPPTDPPPSAPPPADPSPLPFSAAAPPPVQDSSRTGSQPVRPLSPLQAATDSLPSSPPVADSPAAQNAPVSAHPSSPRVPAASLLEQLHNPDPAVHEGALQAIAVRLAEGLSRRVSRIADRAASG